MPFNAKSFLTAHSIPWTDEGKHARPGWIQVKCPLCSGHPGWHGGFNIDAAYYNCWRCGHSWYPKIIAALLKISISKAKTLIKPYLTGEQIREFKTRQYVDKIQYPPDTGPMNNKQKQYLINRNFDPESLESKWVLKGVGRYGPYKGRILAPIRLHGDMISYQTRDITGKARAKYMACPSDSEVYHLKYSLYNIDSCHEKSVVIVEGIFDVWRLGSGAVGTFGIDYLPQQILMLSQRFERAFIFFDNEDQAQEKAEQMSFDLTKFNVECEIITVEEGDPGDLSNKEAQALMGDLGL